MSSTADENQVEGTVGDSPDIHGLDNGQVEITLAPREEEEEEEEKAGSGRAPRRFCSENARKVVYGLLLVVGIAVSWASATQFAKSTFSPTFSAPFFMIWFSTMWTTVCYPAYVLGSFLLFAEKRKGGVRPLFREDQKIFGPKGLTLLNYFKYISPFCLCWMVTNYMYMRALGIIHVTDVTALFATNTAFVYICSWIWLTEKLVLVPAKSFSVVLAIVGTVLMCYADGFEGGRAEGVVLALGSSVGAALYKVLFFRCIGKASYGQVSLFLSLLGLFDVLFGWPVMLTLYLTGVETLDWGNLPMTFLCGSATLGLVFNFLVNFGIAVTFPLFIALGTFVGIPLNAVVDSLFREATFGALKIVGGCLILVGFLIMLAPESVQRKVACWKEGQCPRERQKLDQEEAEAEKGVELREGEEGAHQQAGERWQRLKQTEEDDVET